MTPEHIDEAARALAAARNGPPIAALPEPARPQSEADSYAIQDAVLQRLGERAGGWKVGFSPEGGIFCAPIYASRVAASLSSMPANGFHVIGIECEIGSRQLALAQRALLHARRNSRVASSLHPTIEVVDLRYVDFRSPEPPAGAADNFSNGGLVWRCGIGREDRSSIRRSGDRRGAISPRLRAVRRHPSGFVDGQPCRSRGGGALRHRHHRHPRVLRSPSLAPIRADYGRLPVEVSFPLDRRRSFPFPAKGPCTSGGRVDVEFRLCRKRE